MTQSQSDKPEPISWSEESRAIYIRLYRTHTSRTASESSCLLRNDIPAHEHTFYYRALRTWFAEVFGADAVFDESAKDAARAYYVGYHTREWWEVSNEGKILDWENRARDEEVKVQDRARAQTQRARGETETSRTESKEAREQCILLRQKTIYV